MLRHLPNFLTCLNLFAGCLAVIFVARGQLETGGWLVFAAAALDFSDGLAARALKAYSPLGKELDSLADVVSFGLVPALILYVLLGNTGAGLLAGTAEGAAASGAAAGYAGSTPAESFAEGFNAAGNGPVPAWAFAAFLITVFSALRLARFNIDPGQSDRFSGLPTPANAILIASFPFILQSYPSSAALLANPVFLLAFVLVSSGLLVTPVPLPSLKFKKGDRQGNLLRYIFLGISLLLILLLKFAAVPVIMALYLVTPLYLRIKNS